MISQKKSELVKIGLIQMAMSADPLQNLEKAKKKIVEAANQGAQIVCLPELFRTLYFPVVEKTEAAFSEEVPGEVGEVLSQLSKKHGIVIVGGSVYEKCGSNLYNTAIVCDADGSILGTFRKIHIPHDPGFYECNYFAKGDQGYKVFDTKFGKIAVLICYDQWFPEAARTVALAGAQIIFYPTAIGAVDNIPQQEGSWQEAWENVQRGHAIANNVIVATVNRVGREGTSQFWGGSFVCNAFGKTLVRGSAEEQVLVTEVDFAHSEFVRESWRFFYSRRPETYQAITSTNSDK
jgi:predicted amidohydrolase